MRQNSDVLLKETTVFWRCPFIMVSPNIHIHTYVHYRKTSRKEDEES